MRVDTQLKGYYPDGITREKRLESVFAPEELSHDITGFSLTVDEPGRKRLDHQFRAYSYNISACAKPVVSGPGITFTLGPAKRSAPRILIIDFSTNRTSARKQTYKLNDAGEIRIHGSSGS